MFIIFSKEQCPFCIKAKKLLTEQGKDFKEIKREDSFKTDEQFKKTISAMAPEGFTVKTVPQIFDQGYHVGGHSELVLYLEKEEIAKSLRGLDTEL